MRVATIDIGTNSVLLLVAERGPRGLVAVEQRATVTRLGQGVDRARALHPDAIARTNRCLAEYADAIGALGVERTAVAGTSALRDAAGGEAIASFVEARLGTTLRVISGLEEARLMFVGALSGLELPRGEPIWAFDVGGGSTEVVRGHVHAEGAVTVESSVSFDVGSVRLTERFLRDDPPSSAELEALDATLGATFAGVPRGEAGSPPVGIAGTVTTLAAAALGMADYDGDRVHGAVLEATALETLVHDLASMPVAARRTVPGVHPGRADVIVAGGLIVLALMRRLGASALRVSDRGLRWGLAAEL